MSYLRILASALIGTSMACATSGVPKKTSVRATKRWISSPIPPPLEKRTKQSSVRKDSVLPNGLPVTVIEQSHRPIVSVRLFLPHGSASDPPSAIGGSYFGLTLLGDYHEERSDGRRILAEKSKRLQILEMGGRLRISVGVDASSIGIQGYAVDVDSYIKQLAGVLQKPRAGARSFNGRKESMIHALKDVDLTSDGYFYELLNKTAFGEKSAYSRPVYGTLESLEELSHEDAVAQQTRLLGIEGAHLVIVGKVKAKAVLMTAMKHFGRWNRKTKAKRYDTTKPHVQKRRHVIVVPRQTAWGLRSPVCFGLFCLWQDLCVFGLRPMAWPGFTWLAGSLGAAIPVRTLRGNTWANANSILRSVQTRLGLGRSGALFPQRLSQ